MTAAIAEGDAIMDVYWIGKTLNNPWWTRSSAAVIGGASFVKGGIGDIVGTLIGAVFIAGLQNGLTILNVDTYWQQVCMGLVALLAVGLDRLRKTLV